MSRLENPDYVNNMLSKVDSLKNQIKSIKQQITQLNTKNKRIERIEVIEGDSKPEKALARLEDELVRVKLWIGQREETLGVLAV